MISGILAGGIPGFRMVLCCFTHSLVWPGGFDVLSFVVLPYHNEMIQCYHLLHQLTSFTYELTPVTSLSCLFVLCFWFGVFVFLCFACFGAWFLFRFVGGDFVTVHRTTYRSFTSSLLRPLICRRPAVCVN